MFDDDMVKETYYKAAQQLTQPVMCVGNSDAFKELCKKMYIYKQRKEIKLWEIALKEV